MITSPSEIVDLFSLLHDGGIEAASQNKDTVAFRVAISYLAARVEKTFEYFDIHLHGVKKLSFVPWETKATITRFEDIFKNELEIVEAKLEGDIIVVRFMVFGKSLKYSGGDLRFEVNRGAEIFDQGRTERSFPYVRDLAKAYWDEFEKYK